MQQPEAVVTYVPTVELDSVPAPLPYCPIPLPYYRARHTVH